MAKVIGAAQQNQEPEIELEEELPANDEGGEDEQEDIAAEGDDPEAESDAEGDEEGAEDEEGSAEDDAGAAQERVAASRKKSASDVIREQKAELKKIREERAREASERIATQAREDERRRIESQQHAAVSEAREREMLEAMDPVERVRYESKKSEQRILNELNRTRMEAADAKDHSSFQALIAADPDFSDYAEEVERTLQSVRANGGNTNREAILDYLVGRDARKNKGLKKSTVRAAAERRVKQVSSKAPSGRASSGATRGKGKTPEDRLAGVEI